MDNGGQAWDANAVREIPTATVYRFPASAVIRPQPGARGEQVLVTHRGESILFETPEAMFADARDNDPLARAQLQQIADLQAQAERQLAAAARAHNAALTAKAQAERLLRRIGLGITLAILFAGVCLLGAL